VFVVDDLLGWLIGRLADAGYQKLATVVRGSDQARALKAAVTAAVQAAVAEIGLSDPVEAEQAAEQINKAFRRREPVPLPPGQSTLLEALQVGIAWQLRVVNDAGQPAGSLPGVTVSEVAAKLAAHLVRQIQIRGSQPGSLTPLADQLNHDLTHLQGQRIEGVLGQLVDQVAKLGRLGAPVVPGKPVRLALRPAFLAGREDLLADLDTRLSGDGSGPRVVVLSGLGGAGKTSVAVEYAHRRLGQVQVAWQFPAEDATVLAARFADLAAQLGIGVGGGDPVASVHSVLASSPAGWLLVFDNAPDPTSVAPFLPPAGPGQVLITSRNALWPRQLVEVPVLDLDAAAAFLMDRAGDPDEQVARVLAGELGGLPLALEQAAAYTQASGGILAGYLASFKRRRGDLLARGRPAGYLETVATTWALAFAELERSAPGAAGLLRLLAYCAPEAIPLRLLLQPRPELTHDLAPAVAEVLPLLLNDELAAGDAVAALREYSLARPAGEGAVTVHRLVQAVTADQMPAWLASAWRQAAATLTEAALPSDPQRPSDWSAFAALLPHARAVLDLTSGGMWRIASYLGESGSYPAARDLFGLIVGAYSENDANGAEHPDTLAARHSLARWTGAAGDAARARDQYAALLPIRERILGPEHPLTLATRGELARWTGHAGDAYWARDQYAALLPIEERVLGPEHPDTLATRHGLASLAGDMGDAAAARDQYAALLPIDERKLGREEPNTLFTRANLAFYTGEAGDAAGARDQFAALLPIRERVLGPEHPDTLATRANLAYFTGEAGDAAAARDHYAALLPIMERALDAEHPDTLATRANLARWTGEAGDAAAARDQYAALLPVIARVHGPEHPPTLFIGSCLARWTREAGDDVDTGLN
jgi:Tetratricopeptide repeat